MNCTAGSFTDLLLLGDKELVSLLNEIKNETLLIALIDCEPAVLSRVRSVLSETGRAYLDDDLVRYKESCWSGRNLARQEIIATLNNMIRSNRIVWPASRLCS